MLELCLIGVGGTLTSGGGDRPHRRAPEGSQCGSHPRPSGGVRCGSRTPSATLRSWSRSELNVGLRSWKACWGQPLTSSNLVSSATNRGPDAQRPALPAPSKPRPAGLLRSPGSPPPQLRAPPSPHAASHRTLSRRGEVLSPSLYPPGVPAPRSSTANILAKLTKPQPQRLFRRQSHPHQSGDVHERRTGLRPMGNLVGPCVRTSPVGCQHPHVIGLSGPLRSWLQVPHWGSGGVAPGRALRRSCAGASCSGGRS
ncbi:hypothetical protein EV138_3027 [Kribbella voronezhensis]|uniref:Uncharacterized protein n=1 Tax=Kribbella voronezhensis TaxID=2512212 RepID=A0A4R7TCK6_9ACTN|nr:hypothetical protein EV138_3027 [Kribbella voronezhensis]